MKRDFWEAMIVKICLKLVISLKKFDYVHNLKTPVVWGKTWRTILYQSCKPFAEPNAPRKFRKKRHFRQFWVFVILPIYDFGIFVILPFSTIRVISTNRAFWFTNQELIQEATFSPFNGQKLATLEINFYWLSTFIFWEIILSNKFWSRN